MNKLCGIFGGRHTRRRQCLDRWRVGHQVFITLDQILIVGLAGLDDAIKTRNWPRAETQFRVVGQLFLASTAVLRFTGDFARGEYERFVVPDMIKFYADPGMSGSNMADHRQLVQLLRATIRKHADAIREAPASVYLAYQEFSHMRSTALDAHRHVCLFSAGNRKSIASQNANALAAGEKLVRMATKARVDLAIAPQPLGRKGKGEEGQAAPESRTATRRELDVVIEPQQRCPLARFARLFRAIRRSR